MSLIIYQGVHDPSQDDKFAPVVDKNVSAVITKLNINKDHPELIDVTFQLLNGKYKNKVIVDRVPTSGAHVLAWKYRALRKSANVPYQPGESETIDLEALLLRRAITVDLSITHKDGKDYQGITYKKTELPGQPTAPMSPLGMARPVQTVGPSTYPNPGNVYGNQGVYQAPAPEPEPIPPYAGSPLVGNSNSNSTSVAQAVNNKEIASNENQNTATNEAEDFIDESEWQ